MYMYTYIYIYACTYIYIYIYVLSLPIRHVKRMEPTHQSALPGHTCMHGVPQPFWFSLAAYDRLRLRRAVTASRKNMFGWKPRMQRSSGQQGLMRRKIEARRWVKAEIARTIPQRPPRRSAPADVPYAPACATRRILTA